MRYLKVLLFLILISLLLASINVNSAFVIKSSHPLINAYKNNNLVRLHVVANSNSPQDQYIKRVVREKVIEYLGKKAIQELSAETLLEMENYLKEIINAQGVAYGLKLSYGNYYFPQRTYGDLTLPAGEYQALKIVLGKGEGSNWWCVLMPPLCVVQEPEPALEEETPKLEFKLKLVELIKKDKQVTEKLSWTEQLLKKIRLFETGRKPRFTYFTPPSYNN